MKKYIVIGLLLVVIVIILVSCHDTGGGDNPVVSDTGQTTEAGPPSAETTSATAETATRETVDQTSEVPTTYESGESGNETTEYFVNTEASENTTEGETEAPTEPKPTEPKPTEPKPTEPKPTEPKPTEPKPTNPVHTHSWSGWNQSKAPTCTANGEEVRTCSCGATESRTVNALGHNWSGWSQTKAPTCGAEGAEGRSCSRCGVSESRSVPATGAHSWNETVPTCTAAGSKTCSVCGKSESGSAALGHDWVHHDEEGHWRDVLTCDCGQVFYSYEDWDSHFMSFPREERDNHAGFNNHGEWVVDKPAYDVCSRCGTTR